ncbi:hypothetical protein V7128_01215 [Neobacillus vireti]|uniref:hypothetical protein n=1 Tax=Neobacillus vireti TaxID=220686 RepID=UPI002FFED128
MSRKITYEKILDKINSINGYTMVTKENEIGDIKSRTKFEVKCDKNHIYDTCWMYLRTGSKCTYCSGTKVSIEIIKEFINENNLDYKLISDTYLGSGEKLELICSYGHPFKISWDNLKQGKGCGSCRYRKISESLQMSEIEYVTHVNDDGYLFNRWLEEYHGVTTKCELICPNGHYWETCHDYFKSGARCKYCHFEHNIGENHPRWKGGISSVQTFLRDKLYDWKKETIQKYNSKCDITGLPFDDIHHLYGFNLIIEEAFKITKLPIHQTIKDYTRDELECLTITTVKLHDKYGLGVCLIKEVHNLFHSIYNFGDNIPEQYYEFKQNYLNNNL